MVVFYILNNAKAKAELGLIIDMVKIDAVSYELRRIRYRREKRRSVARMVTFDAKR